MIKLILGIALTFSILSGCATSNGDANKDGSLFDAIVNDVGGGYDRRTKKLEEDLEESKREKKQAEEEQQKLEEEATKKH
jgi:F0F1-type ATP synthase membrane subunit b/b'